MRPGPSSFLRIAGLEESSIVDTSREPSGAVRILEVPSGVVHTPEVPSEEPTFEEPASEVVRIPKDKAEAAPKE